jgi:hypothetical protein
MTGQPPEPATWTLAEAAAWLHPPVSYAQLAGIVSNLPGIQPVGKRPSTGGRPARAYLAADLMDLHASLHRWLLCPVSVVPAPL